MLIHFIVNDGSALSEETTLARGRKVKYSTLDLFLGDGSYSI
ncbi:MAG: hypothetical protein ABII96_04050 [Candidatus Zixiibacteriota bacterium]